MGASLWQNWFLHFISVVTPCRRLTQVNSLSHIKHFWVFVSPSVRIECPRWCFSKLGHLQPGFVLLSAPILIKSSEEKQPLELQDVIIYAHWHPLILREKTLPCTYRHTMVLSGFYQSPNDYQGKRDRKRILPTTSRCFRWFGAQAVVTVRETVEMKNGRVSSHSFRRAVTAAQLAEILFNDSIFVIQPGITGPLSFWLVALYAGEYYLGTVDS